MTILPALITIYCSYDCIAVDLQVHSLTHHSLTHRLKSTFMSSCVVYCFYSVCSGLITVRVEWSVSR